MLEAGKEEPIIANIPGMIYSLADTEFNWRYKTQPEKSALKEINKEVWWPRGKVRIKHKEKNNKTFFHS